VTSISFVATEVTTRSRLRGTETSDVAHVPAGRLAQSGDDRLQQLQVFA
jgi:hypothetical protein